MADQVFSVVSGIASSVLVVGVVMTLLVPSVRDWIKARLALTVERGKAEIELAASYYNRRLEAYLEVWRLTNEAMRAVYNAYNPARPDHTPQTAAACIETLKNYFWDKRPLLSKGVFRCVGSAAQTERRARRLVDRQEEVDQETQREHWQGLEKDVTRVQGALLQAIDGDLRLSGLPSLLGAEEPHETADIGEDREAILGQLVRFVAEAEQRFPWVGRGLVAKNFTTVPPGVRVEELMDSCIDRQYLLAVIEIVEGEQRAALKVNRDNDSVRKILATEVRPAAPDSGLHRPSGE